MVHNLPWVNVMVFLTWKNEGIFLKTYVRIDFLLEVKLDTKLKGILLKQTTMKMCMVARNETQPYFTEMMMKCGLNMV